MFTRNPVDDRHEFKPLLVEIEERPLNPLGRSVYWIVMATILFAALWMVLGRVDIVVTARGKVIPRGEVKTVQPLNTGVVRSIRVRAGDYVTKGQVLMEIDPSNVDPELVSLNSDYTQAALEIERINALMEDRPMNPGDLKVDPKVLAVQQEIYRSEKISLALRIKAKQESLKQLDQRLASEKERAGQAAYMVGILTEKIRRLEKVRDIISRNEFDQTAGEKKRYETELDTSRHRRAELLTQKNQVSQKITFTREEFRNRLLGELAEKKQRSLYLEARIKKAEFISRRQQIISPVDGYISQVLIHTVGGVVSPAEKLARIVPSDSPLQVKAMLQNQDAGMVAEGMDVSIKVDTFDFQKYGTLGGKVAGLSKDSVEHDRLGLVYETFIDLARKSLVVDGNETFISAGMSVIAEIKVGERRIIEFFVYPLIKHLDEGMSVK